MRRLVLAVALLAACGKNESAREEQPMKAAVPQRVQRDGTIRLSDPDRAALGLQISPAAEGTLPNVVLRFGRVSAEPGDEALVVSPMAGRIARAPLVRVGDPLKAGTSLIELRPLLSASEQVSLGVQGAETAGQVEATERELAKNQAAAARARELAASKIISEAKLQESETVLATTRARLEALRRARTVQGQGQGGVFIIRAPITGTLVALNAQLGAPVAIGDVLARVLRRGPRLVDLALAAADVRGDSYEVRIGDRWAAAALVTHGAIVQPDGARHDLIEVAAEDAVGLMPGSVASVRMATGAAPGIVLPESALVPGVETDTVYVESPHGTFTARPVRVRARFAGKALIPAGLKPGEEVVVEGAMALRGESVRSELGQQE